MGYLGPNGGVLNYKVIADLETLNSEVLARFSVGNTAGKK
jgi:hypothetical protein